MDMQASSALAELSDHGLLAVTGPDARAFLHAQLTNHIENLVSGRARYAAYCSPKGRVLANMLVIPHQDGFLLSLSRDLAPAIAKRLSMFVLRAKVGITDASAEWTQFGCWGTDPESPAPLPEAVLDVSEAKGAVAVCIARARHALLVPVAQATGLRDRARAGGALSWAREEIRAGRALIDQATQDQFVPQMLNLELTGAIDFRKGCYPGQEIVARSQYRGIVKRRMYLARTAAEARPGMDLFGDDPAAQPCGSVVNAVAAAEGGSELLAVLQVASVELRAPIHAGSPGGPLLELLPLPYSP